MGRWGDGAMTRVTADYASPPAARTEITVILLARTADWTTQGLAQPDRRRVPLSSPPPDSSRGTPSRAHTQAGCTSRRRTGPEPIRDRGTGWRTPPRPVRQRPRRLTQLRPGGRLPHRLTLASHRAAESVRSPRGWQAEQPTCRDLMFLQDPGPDAGTPNWRPGPSWVPPALGGTPPLVPVKAGAKRRRPSARPSWASFQLLRRS